MRLGVPFIAVPTITHKVEALLEDASLSHKLIDLDTLKSVSGPDALHALGAWSKADEARSRDYVVEAEKAVAACFDEVAARVKVARYH